MDFFLAFVLCLLLLSSPLVECAKRRKKGKDLPKSAAEVAAAMAEAAAQADIEAAEKAAEEEAARQAELERLAALPPEPEVFYCQDCEGNTGGRCKNEITQYCTEMDTDAEGNGILLTSPRKHLILIWVVRGVSGGLSRMHALASSMCGRR